MKVFLLFYQLLVCKEDTILRCLTLLMGFGLVLSECFLALRVFGREILCLIVHYELVISVCAAIIADSISMWHDKKKNGFITSKYLLTMDVHAT